MPVAAPGITNAHPPASALSPQRLNHLRLLEAESIHILREVASEFERPVMLYSIGKDSSVMLRLAQKAFYPGPIPFPLLHIDTGFKFREMLTFRDEMARPGGRGAAGVAQRAGHCGGHQSHCARHQALLRTAEDAGAAGRRCATTTSTRPLAARGATKKNRAPRSASIRSATRPGSGTRRISGRSCGTCTTRAFIPAKAFACFRSRTGRRWTCGSTSTRKRFPWSIFTLPRSGRCMCAASALLPIEQAFVARKGEQPQMVKSPAALAGMQPMHGRDPLRRRHDSRRSSRS